jgi:hypothetical protein
MANLPTSGMKAAARRALNWKKAGKRGGTAVGLARANQIVNGENLSDDTVRRMYSFFSRHEVDKQATGFSAGEEGYPSPGRVAWDLWGGDAGFSWSRAKWNQIQNAKKSFESNMEDEEVMEKRDYSPKQRRAMASRGQAMPDGSFPIADEADLRNAIQSVGRAANYESARRHIIRRARALGLVDLLPEDWKVKKSAVFGIGDSRFEKFMK